MDVPEASHLRKVDATRWAAVASLLALIAVLLVWELGLQRSWWAIKALPLCAPLAGLLKRRLYTYRWTSLLVWPWFAEGVVRCTTDASLASRAFAGAEVALTLALFVACSLHVRTRLSHKDPA